MTVYFHEKLAAARAQTLTAIRQVEVARAEIKQLKSRVVPVASAGRRLTERSLLEDRLAHLLWAAISLSDHGRVTVEESPLPDVKYKGRLAKLAQVTVTWHGETHTAQSDPDIDRVNIYEAVVVAMDRAVQWLRQKVRGS